MLPTHNDDPGEIPDLYDLAEESDKFYHSPPAGRRGETLSLAEIRKRTSVDLLERLRQASVPEAETIRERFEQTVEEQGTAELSSLAALYDAEQSAAADPRTHKIMGAICYIVDALTSAQMISWQRGSESPEAIVQFQAALRAVEPVHAHLTPATNSAILHLTEDIIETNRPT